MKTKYFLLIFFILLSFSCNAEEKSVFEKLNFQPEWEKIPNVDEVKKYFFELSGYDFDEQKKFCNDGARLTSSVINSNEDVDAYFIKKSFCNLISIEKTTYENYGVPMKCKRSDFARSIIEDASSWLLIRDWPKDFYDDWFWKKHISQEKTPYAISPSTPTLGDPLFDSSIDIFIFRNPNILYNYSNDDPVCYAVARDYNYLIFDGKQRNDLPTIKKIEWDEQIPQITYGFARIYSDIIEVDFNNDGIKNLIYTTSKHFMEFNEFYSYVYSNNIEEIKDYLKQDGLKIKNLDEFKEIAEKFNPEKIITMPCKNLSEEEKKLFLMYSKYFEFNNKTYIFNKEYIYLIENNKCNIACSFVPKEDQKLSPDIIKMLALGIISLHHVNEDVYLYDKSFADDIRDYSKKSAYHKINQEAVAAYLKQKVKELCGTDLDKLEE